MRLIMLFVLLATGCSAARPPLPPLPDDIAWRAITLRETPFGRQRIEEYFVRQGHSWRAEFHIAEEPPVIVVRVDGRTFSTQAEGRLADLDAEAAMRGIYAVISRADYRGDDDVNGLQCGRFELGDDADVVAVWVELETGLVRRVRVNGGGSRLLTEYYDLDVPESVHDRLFDPQSPTPLFGIESLTDGDER